MNNPSVEDIKTCSIENLFILKIFFRILNVVFIEDKEDNEIINSESVKLLSNLLEYFLIIGYDSTVVQKEILPGIDEASKNKIEKSFNEIILLS